MSREYAGVFSQVLTRGYPDSHVSPVIFTRTLLPLMLSTAEDPGSDVRIVMVRCLRSHCNRTGNNDCLSPHQQVTSSFVRHLKGYDVRYRNVDDFNQEYSDKLVMASLLRYSTFEHAQFTFIVDPSD